MRFDEIDARMRQYETSNDPVIIPRMYVIVRLDGRGFTNLTRDIKFEKPFDDRFRDLMVDATKTVFDAGFDFRYGYTQSDEISLLLKDSNTTPFHGKIRKFNSVLASHVSSNFTLALYKQHKIEQPAVFDSRVIQLPSKSLVIDYFRWRQEDANRNALNGWAYWTLRKHGMSATSASKKLEKQSVAFKNELLHSYDINYNTLPAWQKGGIGLYSSTVDRIGYDPIRRVDVPVKRSVLQTNLELPHGQEYSAFIEQLM